MFGFIKLQFQFCVVWERLRRLKHTEPSTVSSVTDIIVWTHTVSLFILFFRSVSHKEREVSSFTIFKQVLCKCACYAAVRKTRCWSDSAVSVSRIQLKFYFVASSATLYTIFLTFLIYLFIYHLPWFPFLFSVLLWFFLHLFLSYLSSFFLYFVTLFTKFFPFPSHFIPFL
jgi:hypothetical protein